MKLKKLTIEGFKSYKNKTTIDFEKMPLDHIFLIVGKTGAGKSTILDAITYALFGNFKDQKATSYDFLNANIFDLHQKKSLQKNQILCQIELEFEYKQKTYSIKRIIKTKNFKNYKENLSEIIESEKEIYIYENHQQIPLQDLPFFMEFDHFRKMVVIPQNQFSDFIKMNSEAKSDFLSKIFSLDEVRKFIDFVKEEKERIGNERNSLRESIEKILTENQINKSIEDPTIIEQFEENITKIINEIEKLKKEVEKDKNNKEQKRKDCEKKENVIKKWEEYKNNLEEKNKLEQKKRKIAQNEQIINNAKKVLDLYPIEKRLKEIVEELKNKNNELEKKENYLKQSNNEYNQNQKEKQELENKKEEIEQKKIELKEKEDINSKINIYEKIKNEIEKLEQEKQQLEEHKKNFKKELERIEQNLFDIYKAFLSNSLKKGSPCPVCGSFEHPSPYKGEHLPTTPEKLLKKRQELQEKINEKEKKIEKIEQSIKKKEQEIYSIEDFIKKYYKEISIKEIKERLEKDINDLKEKIEAYKTKLESNAKKEKDLSKKIGELEGTILQLNQSIGDLEKEKKDKNDQLNQMLKQRKLERNDIFQFYKDLKEIEKLEKEIKEFNERFNKIDSVINKTKEEIEELYPNFFNLTNQELEIQTIKNDISKLKNEIQQLENQIQDKDREIGSLEERKKNLIDNLKNLKEGLVEYRNINKEFQLLELLYQILDGKNSKNLSFDRYLLQVYFDIIIQNANSRLRSINGRYHLVTTIEKEKQKQQKYGLGLKIFDQYHGVERPIYDLSGGETFYVSLALALGLNDMFHQRFRNAQIDFLFIDEGFGSLDQETLDTVISTLEEYFIHKSGHRQVGLISHVESMKERFPNQIIVENYKGISKIIYKN